MKKCDILPLSPKNCIGKVHSNRESYYHLLCRWRYWNREIKLFGQGFRVGTQFLWLQIRVIFFYHTILLLMKVLLTAS